MFKFDYSSSMECIRSSQFFDHGLFTSQLELPKILDKHKAKLDTEVHEFELKMEQKRKSVMLELKGRMQTLIRRKLKSIILK